MMSAYVKQIFKDLSFGHHVFHIKMEQIQKLEKLKSIFDYSVREIDQILTLEASSFFPNLKSLSKTNFYKLNLKNKN